MRLSSQWRHALTFSAVSWPPSGAFSWASAPATSLSLASVFDLLPSTLESPSPSESFSRLGDTWTHLDSYKRAPTPPMAPNTACVWTSPPWTPLLFVYSLPSRFSRRWPGLPHPRRCCPRHLLFPGYLYPLLLLMHRPSLMTEKKKWKYQRTVRKSTCVAGTSDAKNMDGVCWCHHLEMLVKPEQYWCEFVIIRMWFPELPVW